MIGKQAVLDAKLALRQSISTKKPASQAASPSKRLLVNCHFLPGCADADTAAVRPANTAVAPTVVFRILYVRTDPSRVMSSIEQPFGPLPLHFATIQLDPHVVQRVRLGSEANMRPLGY